MATFTSGISWETDEWFRTFSESFPQYTQPGIWIAAEERLASLRGAKLEWDATTRTVRLKLKNSRGQPYTLAMHFYPGAVHAAAPIVEAAAKIPGLLECLRAGDLPAPLLEAINASGLDIFMRRPGSIQFDPGMMSSECALLIAAFMHDLELDPGRWFKFIGIDFQKTADEALSAAGDNHAAPQSPDGPAAETLSEAQANAASAANAQEPLFAAGEALTGTFPFADLEDDALRLSADIAPADIADLGAEANLTRLRLWQAPGVPMLSPTIVSALPSSGLSAVQAKRSWCAFGDIEARTFMQNLLSAASLTADEALKMLARREARQERLGTASPNSKWTRFLLSTIEKEPSAELPPMKLLSGHHPWDRIVFALQTEDQSIHWAEESGDMIMALLIPTRRDLAGADASFVVWRALAEAAAQILAARAVLPLPAPAHYESDAADQSADGMCVYWHPALNAPGVKNLLSQVSALIGPLLPLQPLAPQCRAFAGLSTHPDAPYSGVYLALTLLITSLMRHTSKRNREIARHLVGRRVRSTLTGEGFAPNAASLPDLKNVLAGFFALPIAGAALPAKLLLTGVLENGALKLTLSLPPRQGPRKGEPLTLADWDDPEGNTAGPNSIVREALQLLAADYPLFAEFGPNFDQPSQIERSRWEYFLFTELPELSACGVDAVLPESMRRIEKPEIVLTAAPGNARMQKRLATQGMLNAAALADFRWEIAVGDERMTLAELRARINQEGELLSSGSALFHLTKEDLDRLVAEWAEAQKKELSNWDKLRALLSGSSNGRRVEAAEALLERIRESAAVKELPPPVELNAVLRPYQIRGFSWLVQNAMLGLGSLLADDMGLGKTVQVIACVAELKARGELDRGKVLIAAPASLLVNWEREIERFAPGITALIYHGKDRTIFALDHSRPDVIITSYGILKRELPQLSQMQ
ncbi:SNF2-related protein [Sutterella wadsworthensis]